MLGPLLLLTLTAAQPDSLVARGHALADRAPREALALFQQALAHDSLDYEANWRAAAVLVDIGKDTPDTVKSATRDSAYLAAERFARRAIRVDSMSAEGHFALAMALGRVALTRSRKDRVRYAVEIYSAATRTLAIDPRHDGAHHVLGLWHAEAMRTSGFNRFLARNLLGGKILGQASWARAIEHLEAAVRLDPDRIFHRLDLARVYQDRKRYGDTRRELAKIAALPNQYRLDPRYHEEAAALARAIAGRADPKPADP